MFYRGRQNRFWSRFQYAWHGGHLPGLNWRGAFLQIYRKGNSFSETEAVAICLCTFIFRIGRRGAAFLFPSEKCCG